MCRVSPECLVREALTFGDIHISLSAAQQLYVTTYLSTAKGLNASRRRAAILNRATIPLRIR